MISFKHTRRKVWRGVINNWTEKEFKKAVKNYLSGEDYLCFLGKIIALSIRENGTKALYIEKHGV